MPSIFFSLTSAAVCFDQPRLVHLVGNLGDDDLLPVLAHALDGGFGADLELPRPVV